MPRKKKESVFICPSCGAVVKEPERTWSLVSPIPDKYGRVTITIMGSFRCPNCGYTWKGVLKKMKSGGEEKGEEEETKPEPGEVIEIDISDLDSVEEEPPDL